MRGGQRERRTEVEKIKTVVLGFTGAGFGVCVAAPDDEDGRDECAGVADARGRDLADGVNELDGEVFGVDAVEVVPDCLAYEATKEVELAGGVCGDGQRVTVPRERER